MKGQRRFVERLTTVVTFTLTAVAGGVVVPVEQSGFPLDGDQYYEGANYGWQRFIGGLERVVASL